MAYAYTVASTFTRIALLTMQIRDVLRRTTSIDLNSLDRLAGAIEKKWIEKIHVYAFNRSKLCCAELVLSIEWSEYGAQIAVGKTTVAIDQKWTNNIAIEVDEAIRAFNRHVAAMSLRTQWAVVYATQVYNNQTKLNEVRRALGTSPTETVRWIRKPDGRIMTIEELPELRVGLFLAD